MASEYVSLEQALRDLKLKEEELKTLVSNGEIRTYMVGNDVRFKKDEVNRLKQETGKTMFLGAEQQAPVDEKEPDEDDEIAPFEEAGSPAEEHLTFAETRRLLRLSDTDLQRFVARGELQAVGSGSDAVFRKADVERLLSDTGATVLKTTGHAAASSTPEVSAAPDDSYTFAETRKKLRLNSEELHALVKSGELTAVGAGNQMRFDRGEVDRLEMGTGRTVLRSEPAAPELPSHLMPFEEARKKLQLKAEELNRCVEAGQLEKHQHGNETVFKREDIEKLVHDTGATMMVSDAQRQAAPSASPGVQVSPEEESLITADQARAILRLDPAQFDSFLKKGTLHPVAGSNPPSFKREDIERIANDTGSTMMVGDLRQTVLATPPLADPHDKNTAKDVVSARVAREMLRLSPDEFKRLVAAGQIKPVEGSKPPVFKKKTIERLANDTGSTMMVDHVPAKAGRVKPSEAGAASQPHSEAAPSQLLSMQKAAQILMLKPDELKRLVQEGAIRVFKEPDGWKFDAAEIRNLSSDTGATIAVAGTTPADSTLSSSSSDDEIAPFDSGTFRPRRRTDSDVEFDAAVGQFQESDSIPIQRQKKSLPVLLIIIVLVLAALGAFLAHQQGWI